MEKVLTIKEKEVIWDALMTGLMFIEDEIAESDAGIETVCSKSTLHQHRKQIIEAIKIIDPNNVPE